MKKGKLIEQKQLTQINLTEGFMKKLFKLLMRGPLNRALKKGLKGAMDDPELKAKLADLQRAHKLAKDGMKDYCKKNPDSELCDKKGVFGRRYGFK